MRSYQALVVGILLAAAASSPALAGESTDRAIPPWARKYNMNCSGCHYPSVPRLNARGLRFKWAGYRMPDEIREVMEAKRIEEYIGALGIVQYVFAKSDGTPADVSALAVPSASLFAAGSVGSRYGAYLEFEREEEGSVDLVGQVVGVWGKETAFGGVRAGQGHLVVGGAIAGFDRPLGVLTPLPLASPTTSGSPFTFAGDVTGVEAFYVWGLRNRASVQMANGVTATPEGMEAEPSTRQDWIFANQLMWDDRGAGVTAVAYLGSIAGLDTTQRNLRSRYTRLGLSANKYFGPFEALAGLTLSRDTRLPLGPQSPFASQRTAGTGYWLSGTVTAKSYASVYGRYETLDIDTDADDDALRRIIVGGVLPFSVPEYFRVGVEFFRDMPQATGSPRRTGVAGELRFAF